MLSSALASLPHGPEFRFVDELTALEPGKSASGRYLIKGTESFLPGHFPSQPVFPAVILIEAIAQVAGIAAQTDPERGGLANLRLTAVRGVKILGAATPREHLDIHAEIVGRLGGLIQAQGRVLSGERLLAEGQVTLSAEVQ